MALPPLVQQITADTSGLDAAVERSAGIVGNLGSATQGLAQGFNRLGDMSSNLGRRMLPVSGIVSGVATGMAMLANSAANAGNELDKAAQAAGIGVGPLQELQFALSQVSRMSDEQTSAALLRLNRVLGEAAGGSQAAIDALAAIGVSAEQAASGAISTEDAFMRFVEAAQNMTSPGEASALAVALLGRNAAELGPILMNAGGSIDELRARAQELGIVMSDDAVAAAALYNDKMDELSRQTTALRNTIGIALLPIMTSMIETMQDRVVPAIQSMVSGVAGAIEWFGSLPQPIQEFVGVITGALAIGGPVLMAIGVFSRALAALTLATGPVGLLIAAASLLTAAWLTWGDDIKRIVGDAVDWVSNRFPGITEAFEIVTNEMRAQFEAIVDLVRAIFNGDLQGIMDSFVTIFTTPFRIIAGLFMSDFAEPLRTGIMDIVTWVQDRFNELVDYFVALPGRFIQLGSDIIQGLWEGIRAGIDRFNPINAITEMGAGMFDSIAGFFQSQSPSRLMMQLGEDIVHGLAIGIENAGGLAIAAMQTLGQAISGDAFNIARDVVGAMGQMFQGSKPIAAAMALINTFQGITEALKLPFPASLVAVAKVAAQGFAAVRGIQNARPGSGAPSAGAATSAGGGGSTSTQVQEMPTQTLRFDFGGQSAMGMDQLVNLLNDAYDRGYRIRAVMA
jgi:hypothetical protein